MHFRMAAGSAGWWVSRSLGGEAPMILIITIVIVNTHNDNSIASSRHNQFMTFMFSRSLDGDALMILLIIAISIAK